MIVNIILIGEVDANKEDANKNKIKDLPDNLFKKI